MVSHMGYDALILVKVIFVVVVNQFEHVVVDMTTVDLVELSLFHH
jgi:hypothetical protein